MTKNFKNTADRLVSTHSVSKNPAFIIDVCKHLEIEDYLYGYLNSLGFKITQSDMTAGFVSTNQRLYALPDKELWDGKTLLYESIEIALEIYEYCHLSKLDKTTIKNSIIGILMYYHDQFNYRSGKSADVLDRIHNEVKESKRITENSLGLVQKIIIAKPRAKQKMVFPLDILQDVKRLRFLQAQSEGERQSIILPLWVEFRERFEQDFRYRSFSLSNSELSWTYFNFRAWLISGKWGTTWAKNKAICLNWNKKIKDSLEFFSKLEPDFSEDSLAKFYQSPKKGT